ncbi:MAG: hypothetical protein BGO49_28355 [Planctomycetales bacterium 71-10]|nr:MAG: hypothetical protein BGO49_28355 [Planctomycetales bacterium 71-10]
MGDDVGGYRVALSRDARTALDHLTKAEAAFLVAHLLDLADRPSDHAEAAGPLTFPGGGMISKAVMPALGGDATYFIVNFRFSADETTIAVSSIDVYRPPVGDDPDLA